jgi:hypothetical protein
VRKSAPQGRGGRGDGDVADHLVRVSGSVLEDLRLRRPGKGLLVERVGDDLAQSVRDGPVFQHPLDVEIKLAHAAEPFPLALP